jgi:ubiquinone/menaquinone biosynthesis C-methylase UbiE
MSVSDSAWPEVWSALYDAMDLDRTPHLAFYTALVTPQTRSLLDLGCGTGSITVKIAEAMAPGGRVVGVDLSPKMIEIAAERAPQFEWAVADICDPGVEGSFDLIVICFHTLQALQEDSQIHRAFAAISRLLAPGGCFAFDIYQPNEAWLAAVDPAPNVVRQFADAQGRSFEVIESNAAYNAQTRILSGEWRLKDVQNRQMLQVAPIVQRVRQYYPADIDRALAGAGMVAVESFGDLDRRPFAPGTKRQVYICKRA